MALSGLQHYITPIALAAGLLVTPYLSAQTRDKAQMILQEAVESCNKTPQCNAKKEFFMKNDPILHPDFQLDEYDKKRMEEAFALGWREGEYDRNTGKITKKGWVDDVDLIKAGWVNPWENATVLFNIDNYPCVSQCKETRNAAYNLLEYTFNRGLDLRQRIKNR